MSIFNVVGNVSQTAIVWRAIDRCWFPFERLLPSLQMEGKKVIEVFWADLSHYNATNSAGSHSHVHVGDAQAHPIERTIGGRKQVLGLFYMPPHTRIVLDQVLVHYPDLAMEVFLAEVAHAVDYHSLTPNHRRKITNLLHTEQLPPDHPVGDGVAFRLDGHECSWFDVGPYEAWVGEAFMESFIEAFSDVRVTIQLNHPTSPEVASQIHNLLLPPMFTPSITPAPEPVAPTTPTPPGVLPDVDLTVQFVAALRRFLKSRAVPKYLRNLAEKWLGQSGL